MTPLCPLLLLAVSCCCALPSAHAADPGSIWFPRVSSSSAAGPDRVRTRDLPAEVPLQQIPVEILLKLSDIENVTYFLNNFVDTDTLTSDVAGEGTELENRFGPVDERKSIQSAKPALCKPQLELVPLMVPTDPTMYYYPTCTRIERCGGCCGGSNLLSCQPTETEIVNMKVILTQYTGNKQLAFKGHEIIPLERHTKCKCDCTTKETDTPFQECNQFQEYRKNECQCVCMNVDEQQKCIAESPIKKWDASTCTCKCRETRDCNSGNYYDQDLCRCAEIPSLRNRRREIISRGIIQL